MIQSFRHKGLQRLFVDGEPRGIRPDWIEKIENILAVLNRARVPEDMNLPGFRLHLLKGDLKSWTAPWITYSSATTQGKGFRSLRPYRKT